MKRASKLQAVGTMDPNTNVEEREQWRAKIKRALSELQPSDLSHLQAPALDNCDSQEQAEV
jgi:hypothetical protein